MEQIIFAGGTYLKVTEEPRWNEFHKRFYAGGYRWIKSKKRFSSSELLHNFEHFEKVENFKAGE